MEKQPVRTELLVRIVVVFKQNQPFGFDETLTTTYIWMDFLFFKWAILGLYFAYFAAFLSNATQILHQINVKNVHPVSSVRIRTHNLQLMSLFL